MIIRTLRRNLALLVLAALAISAGVFVTPGVAHAAATVTTYPAPQGANLSSAYTMTVSGTSNPVYFTGTHNAHYAYFDFSGGSVQVQVTSTTNGYWNNGVVIRPDSQGVTATVSGNTITFTLSQNGHYSIERPDLDYTSADTQALIIAANPPETNVPSRTDPNVLYYGPGIYTITSDIVLASGKTLYVAGGAVLNMAAQITSTNTSNITIRGRGIIYSTAPFSYMLDINLSGVTTATIDGIAVAAQSKDHENFFALARSSIGVTFNNVKFFGTRIGNDFIDCNACTNVTVQNSFCRSEDDCFAFYADQNSGNSDNRNFLATSNVLWPLESGPVRIGTCDHAGLPLSAQVHGLTVSNSDVLHMSTRRTNGFAYLLDMEEGTTGGNFCGGTAKGTFAYQDILFNNLRINQLDEFVNINLDKASAGTLRNLTFSNITVATRPVRTTMYGLNNEGNPGWSYIGANDVDQITFKNVSIVGQVAKSPEDLGATLHGGVANNASPLVFQDASGNVITAHLAGSYKLYNKQQSTYALQKTSDSYRAICNCDAYYVVATPGSLNYSQQVWNVQHSGDGIYTLTNKADSGYALHKTGTSYSPICNCDAYYVVATPTSWNSPQQRWYILGYGGGYYRLISQPDSNYALQQTNNLYTTCGCNAYNVVASPRDWDSDLQLWQMVQQ